MDFRGIQLSPQQGYSNLEEGQVCFKTKQNKRVLFSFSLVITALYLGTILKNFARIWTSLSELILAPYSLWDD